MANLTFLTIIITISALCVSLVRVDQEARKNMKFRPFEFGFFIEGQQHRHEKQDERGIRMGQFGFITADGIYHITVYATDENGKFKILSMKSQPYEQYLKSLEVRAGQMTTAAPPITAASRKPQTIFDFNSKACSGCSIRGEQVVTEASNQETYKSELTPFAIDPRISDGTSPTLHIIEKTLPRIFEEISENSFPRTLPIGGNNENVNAPRSGFVGPIQNKNFNREKVAINRPDRKNDLGKLGKPSNSVFLPDQSTKLPILGAKKKPSHTTIQRTFQEIYENSFPRTLPIGESNEKVNAPKAGFVGPIQNKNLNRVRAVNSNLSKNIDYELEKSSSSPEQRTKIPNLGTTKAPQIQKTSSKSFHSGEKAFTVNSSSYTATQKTPTQNHRDLSITSSQRKLQTVQTVTKGSPQTQNTTPLNTVATFTQTPRRTFTNPSSDSETTVKKYATSTPRINEERTMSTESRREGEHIDKHPSPHFLPTSHRKQVSTPGKEASLKTLDTRTHTTQQHETHFTPPPPTQSDENTTKYNPAKDNTELTLSDTNPIASSTHIIPTTLKLPNAIVGHKSTRIFSDSITTSAKKAPQTGKSTKVLSAASGAPTTSKPPKIDISRPTQRTDNQNVPRMSGENRPNAIANRDANDNDAGDLYRFKYILDYNGHSETGSTNGNKKGNYFIIGNDNMERVVEYIANENGFQPRVRWRKIEESKLKPKENSLKEYEFVWFNSGNHR